MSAPTGRIAAFCAVSIGILCWWTSSPRSDLAGDQSHYGQPQLLDQDLEVGARPLGQEIERSVDTNSRFDPHVKPASSFTNALMLAQAAPTLSGSFAITEVSQANVAWPISAQVSEVSLIDTTIVTLKGTGAITKDIVIQDLTLTPGNPQSPSQWEVSFTLTTAGATKLVVTDSTNPSSIAAIQLRVPTGSDSDLRQPTMTQVSNNAFADPAGPITGTKLIYGRFLELGGEKYLSGTQLTFPVFKNGPNAGESQFVGFASLKRTIIPRQDAVWNAELEMPQLVAGEEGYVLVMATKTLDGLHRYSNNVVGERFNFKIGRNDTVLAAPSKPVIAKGGGTAIQPDANGLYRLTAKEFQVSGTASGDAERLANARIAIYLNNRLAEVRNITINTADSNKWSGKVKVDSETTYSVAAATVLGRDSYGATSDIANLQIRSTAPSVIGVDPSNAALGEIKVTFNEAITAPASADALKAAFLLVNSKGETTDPVTTTLPKLDASDNSITLKYTDVRPDVYTFTVTASSIANLFDIHMEKDFETKLFRSIGAEEPTISRGITGPTGPYVEFSEYLKPRPIVNGFNPSDHVDTRVSRLYYFRDAHRVAQIVNRDAKSYNRAAVKMQEQLADKARTIADQATDDRRAKEREAVKAAEKTREAEREMQQAEANAQRAAAEAANANAQVQQNNNVLNDPSRTLSEAEKAQLNNQVAQASAARTSMEEVFRSERRRADAAADKVQALREKEAAATERWQGSIAVEDRARENQFRREVAAANADPDTYAPGKPDSEDPVRQVSVSVIGEGLIQLRGPIKGINVIRTMINQIDAPVGQVRVGVHTVQINGEKGDRMEVVAGKIQRYIDHSRFLTLQSAEMLRKAIVQVAAQRAMELGNVPGMTQDDRDRSYLYSFFGQDFIHELEAMDSEFLATGNKLLSIHSMDATSLASAMFIMALAKNTTRMQILQTFEAMMQGELPMAEQHYFEAGLTCDGKHKLFGKYCHKDEFCMLSENARFQSIRGMFNVEIANDDTMTPFQREFVRLAQIFKSRLIVEMELKQRIMERAVIEERLGDHQAELLAAKKKEDEAKKKLEEAQGALVDGQKAALVAIQQINGLIPAAKQAAREAVSASVTNTELARRLFKSVVPDLDEWKVVLVDTMKTETGKENLDAFYKREKDNLLKASDESRSFSSELRKWVANVRGRWLDLYRSELLAKGAPEVTVENVIKSLNADPKKDKRNFELGGEWKGNPFTITISPNDEVAIKPDGFFYADLAQIQQSADNISKTLNRFNYEQTIYATKLAAADKILNSIKLGGKDKILDHLYHSMIMFDLYLDVATHLTGEKLGKIIDDLNQVSDSIGGDASQLNLVYSRWVSVQDQISDATLIGDAPRAFRTMLESKVEYDLALRQAEAARRPLDHKKFLDMLVDEMEDKYIELLEGTRAHTANIDAYIKRLMTSLDDDFNTQFYYPTFRKVREASQMWDVQMGQVETTTVLANNRAFAKVSPEATMEFDLPKRDILIAEAMNGAKAMIDDFGALAQDPTFLAMAQMGSGSPTSSPMAGASGGQSTVRNVLPGLSTDTAESVMGQQGPGGSKFGSAMEALIPDPAIYKFETGTGWEIRPVIQPDGQALVFHFNYMYTTNIREPVRADEKHLGRVKRHFVDTDVQLSNFELREISRYTVALKASRTSRGVPLFEDIPLVGVLFRPQPSDESSLQQNVILGQATIFPTVFDLMGLRWAPVVADLDPLRLSNDEFVVRGRRRALMNRVFDQSSSKVDEFLRIPEGERRMDLYRSQETIPATHPDGYNGPGANLRDSQLQEGYDPTRRGESQFVPGQSSEGNPYLRSRRRQPESLYEVPLNQPHAAPEPSDGSSSRRKPGSPNGVASAEYRSSAGEPRFAGEQTEYLMTQPRPDEPRSAVRMQRLPTTDGSPRPLPVTVTRPVTR